MIKNWKPALLALLLWAGCVMTIKKVYGYEQSKAFVNARNLTVLISQEGLEGTGRDTGVLLDTTHVLTCAHMVHSTEDIFWIYTYPLNKVVLAHLEDINQRYDLAVLVLDSSVPVVSPPVFQDDVKEGEPVYVIGNMLGSMKWFVSKGVISGQEGSYLLTDALVNPGNSGGPWINEKGEIVALTDWRIGPVPSIPGCVGGISGKIINRELNKRKHQDDLISILGGLQ